MLVAVHIASFAVQADKNIPLVVLQETGGSRNIAVPMAPSEASAIAIKSLNVYCEKPLTIDVLKTVIDALGGRLDKVVIRAMADGFSSRLYIHANTQVKVIECCTGDAIGLAMRGQAPMFVDEEVFNVNTANQPGGGRDTLRRTISSAATLDFGSYHLQ